MSSSTVIKSASDFEQAISLPGVTVIKFYSLKCPICVAMNPVFDRIASSGELQAMQFYKLDTDENAETKELSKDLPEIPHFRVFRNGLVFARFTGYRSWWQLKDWLMTCTDATKQVSASTAQPSRDTMDGDNDLSSLSDGISNTCSSSLGNDKIVITNTLKELGTLSTAHKHLVIGFYKAHRYYSSAMINAFKTVAAMTTFREIKFVVHDSDSEQDNQNNEMFSERFLLSHQSWVMVLRHGEEFGNLKGLIRADSLKDWLMEYLDANEIADSAGTQYQVERDRKKNDPHTGALPCSNLYLPAAPPFIEVSTPEDLRKLISQGRPVVVIFHNERSMQSQAMQSVLNRAASLRNFQSCVFCIIDFIEREELARELGIVKCPSFIIFFNGTMYRKNKAMEWAELENWLTQSTQESIHENAESCESICNANLHDTNSNVSMELSTVLESSLSPVQCKGGHKDRTKTPWYRRRKPFVDPEPSCVFCPLVEEGLQIGRANEGESYFNITLWHTPGQDRGHISFGVSFGPDPTINARFESALFNVTFGYNGIDTVPKILDVQPRDQQGASTQATWGRREALSLDMSVGYNGASLMGTSSFSRNVEFTRETASRVTGNGVRSPTAVWTLKEDDGPAGQHGLGAQYDLSVSLPTASLHVWMKFWAKAVLIGRNGRRAVLEIGTREKPYIRYLDLGNSTCTSRKDTQ